MKNDDYNIIEQEVKIGLERERKEITNKKSLQNVLQFYDKHKNECNTAFNKYKLVGKDIRQYVNPQKTVNSTHFKEIIKAPEKENLLILTANDIENSILIYRLKEAIGKKLDCYLIDDSNHNECVSVNSCTLGDYSIIHYHVGKTGDEYTRRAINEVSSFFEPNFIILLGICYGLDMDSQELGMVNISEQITGVRINFYDTPDSDEIIFDPEIEFEEYPNNHMTTTITRKLNNMEIRENNDSEPIMHMFGNIVSANCLMSCKPVKDSIINKLQENIRGKKKLIGGEMEACGIFKANYRSLSERWIVIKSICDWGESKNSLSPDKKINEYIKNCLQAFAMMNSCTLLNFLINNKAFR